MSKLDRDMCALFVASAIVGAIVCWMFGVSQAHYWGHLAIVVFTIAIATAFFRWLINLRNPS